MKTTCISGPATPGRVARFIRLIRIKMAKAVVKIILPRGLFVGKHFGAYTQRWTVLIGRIDSRGILQGMEDNKA